MNMLSILITALLLTGPLYGQGRSALPIAAQFKETPLHGYDAPDLGTRPYPQEAYTFQDADAPLVVYETKGIWFRVTPSSFPREVWVDGNRVSLNEALSISESPPYLGKMATYFKELEERSHVTGCAIALEEIGRPYTGPSFDNERTNMLFVSGPEGAVMEVYRQQNGWYEIYNEGIDVSLWIPAKEASFTRTFPGPGEPCKRAFSTGSAPVYMLLRSGWYRAGPSSQSRPFRPYHSGEIVQALAESSGGWLAAKIDGSESLSWFLGSDAAKSIPFPVSALTSQYPAELRSAPRNNADLLYSLGTNDYIILYEEFSNRGETWYRATPDGFFPAAWILAKAVEIKPLKPTNSIDVKAAYLDYLTTNNQRHIEATPAQQESQTSSFTGIAGTCGLILLLVLGILFTLGFALSRYNSAQTQTTHDQESPMKRIGNSEGGDPIRKHSDEPTPIQLHEPTSPITEINRHPLNAEPLSFFASAQRYINNLWRLAIEREKLKTEMVDKLTEQKQSIARYTSADGLAKIEQEKINQDLASLQRKEKIEEAETNRRLYNIERQIQEDSEKTKTNILEQQVRQAKLTLNKRGHENAGKERPPQRELSIEDQVRKYIARFMSKQVTRANLIAEAHSKCADRVRRGEMTKEDMEHFMESLKAAIDDALAKMP